MGRRIPALRPDDLFQAEVELVNLELAQDGDTLVRQDTTAIAQVVLHLPYQHLREPASDIRMPVAAVAAGETHLAFEIPKGVDRLPLHGDLLTALESVPPAPWHSLIELPGRVLNWVYANGPWRLGAHPEATAGRTGLWRADLRGTALNAAGWRDSAMPWESVPSAAEFRPLRHGYFRTDGLTLSPFGATTRLSGPFSYDMVYSGEVPQNWPDYLETYDHTISLGRDTRVRVATPGYLSTGHRAVVVTTRARVLVRAGSTHRARLLDETRLMVSQSEVDYAALAGAYRYGGREMPVRRLRVLLDATPPLSEGCVRALHREMPFWVDTVSGGFTFPVAGTDWGGAEAQFTMPLVFVPDSAAGDFERATNLYRGDAALRERVLGGQRVTLAAPDAVADATVPVGTLTFDLAPRTADVAGYRPAFVLTVPSMRVHLDAVAHFTGDHAPVQATLHPYYLSGMDNQAGAFLALANPVHVPFAGAAAGGLARPSTEVAVATARDGVVPRGFEAPGAVPDVTALFGGARILGFVPLADLLSVVGLDAPKLSVRDGGASISYRWQPKLTNRPGHASPLTVNAGGPSTLDLEVTADRPANGAPATSVVRGRLTNVAFGLAGVATVRFAELSFASVPGRAPDVGCSGCELTFSGPLEFLNTLRSLLPSSFAGVTIEVTEAGIVARYALTVPGAGVGVAALTNLALRTELRIPFADEPTTLRFALSERHHPCTVTVGMFGGGGFFALVASTKGVESLEAAIEFGGAFCLDIGVATGGVYLMAGVYFALSDGSCVLTGYVRCGGYVSVLGIVSISVEFYLALEFRKDAASHSTEVWGHARVTVGIQVLLFSTTVTLPFERRFAGAEGDPPFIECVTPGDWDTYCGAFA